LKVMHDKGSANHRELEKAFYMSFNRTSYNRTLNIKIT
jgi:hypothetical protein